jgi:hypothetical protein
LLSKAVEWGWIERPPAKVRKLKEDNCRIVYLTAAQAESLLESAKADQNRQIYPFILIEFRPPYTTTHRDNPFGAGGSRSADSKTDQRSQNDGNGGALRASVRRAYCGRNGKA